MKKKNTRLKAKKKEQRTYEECDRCGKWVWDAELSCNLDDVGTENEKWLCRCCGDYQLLVDRTKENTWLKLELVPKVVELFWASYAMSAQSKSTREDEEKAGRLNTACAEVGEILEEMKVLQKTDPKKRKPKRGTSSTV